MGVGSRHIELEDVDEEVIVVDEELVEEVGEDSMLRRIVFFRLRKSWSGFFFFERFFLG